MVSDAHFIRLITYIHCNPQKHGFVEDFRTRPYSSYAAMLSTQSTRVQRETVLAWYCGRQEFARSHHFRVAEDNEIGYLVVEDGD